MKPDPIDNILAQAAQRALPPDAGRAAVQRIRSTVLSNLRPVRPLAPLWVFTLALLALFAIFAVGGALPPGLYGIRVLSQFQRVLIFPVLVAAAWLAAAACAREMRPAAGSHLGAIALLLSPVHFPFFSHFSSTITALSDSYTKECLA